MHTDTCRPRCNVAHARIALEHKIIRYTLRLLTSRGWLPFSVWDGQEDIPVRNMTETVNVTDTVDISIIRVRHTTKNRQSWFSVIRGEGIDVVGAEWGNNLDADMMAITDDIQEKYA